MTPSTSSRSQCIASATPSVARPTDGRRRLCPCRIEELLVVDLRRHARRVDDVDRDLAPVALDLHVLLPARPASFVWNGMGSRPDGVTRPVACDPIREGRFSGVRRSVDPDSLGFVGREQPSVTRDMLSLRFVSSPILTSSPVFSQIHTVCGVTPDAAHPACVRGITIESTPSLKNCVRHGRFGDIRVVQLLTRGISVVYLFELIYIFLIIWNWIW